jgi:pyruvate formate lyase activating enzyme
MRIAELQKLTLLDYPGEVACIVFTRGCNLRCPFCQNPDLVLPEFFPEGGIPCSDAFVQNISGGCTAGDALAADSAEVELSERDFFEFLDRRRGKLSGVVISGGEPAVHVDLPEFIARIREKGFLVKLDTNGMNPGMLRRIIEASLVDYVAMDVKNSPKKYAVTCGFASDPSLRLWRRAEESISVLMSGHVPYEFRTTVAIGLHTDEDILEMAQHIRGARAWYLQQFIDGGSLVGAAGNPALRLVSPSPEALGRMRLLASEYVPNAALRGV